MCWVASSSVQYRVVECGRQGRRDRSSEAAIRNQQARGITCSLTNDVVVVLGCGGSRRE